MSELDMAVRSALDLHVPLRADRAPAWGEVLDRAGVRTRRTRLGRSRALRVALVLAAIFLVLAGVATATHLLLKAKQPPPLAVALDADGRLRTVWRCPVQEGCGAFVVDVAVARGGLHLALVTDSSNSLSLYQGGIHVIDLATGVDRHLSASPPQAASPAARLRAWRRHYRAAARFLGCAVPHELAWVADGSRLAYVCSGRIYTIRSDGGGRQLLRTGTTSAHWPTWSPDGTRIAFSTELAPVVHTIGSRGSRGRRWIRSAIYVVDVDGARRRLVTRAGAAPDWSPDGRTIAFWALGCAGGQNETGRTRLVNPEGRDLTPYSHGRCRGIGPANHPVAAWSPDGRRLAVRTWNGLYVMDVKGTHVRRIPGTDGYGNSRPPWAPPER